MRLLTTITSIAENLRTNKYRNETEVREAIVNRVLHELGWDIYNPEAVRREFGTEERRRVDFALFTSPNSPSVFIEVKAPNWTGEGDRQLFEYAFHQGAPFAILVNGREWSFYLPGEQGTYLERRVHKLDLTEREPTDSVKIFERYLAYDRIKNGAALKDAREDYQSAARDRQARDAIPKAWSDLISEPDDLLIDLIAEKVVSLIGFRPIDEYVEEFLAQLNVSSSALQSYVPTPREGIKPPSKKPDAPSSANIRTPRRVSVVMLGERTEHADAISALIFILKRLEQKKNGFLEKFALAAPGRRRNHISRNRSEVYPNKPDLEVYTTNELGDGWWLGTNIANREKQRLLKIACEVSGLKFGKDIQIDLPNTGD